MLLGAHPEACTVGELKGVRENPQSYRCSCGALIRECGFWLRINAAMARRGLNFAITEAGTNIQNVGHWYLRRLLDPLHRPPVLEFIRDAFLSALPAWHSHLRNVQCRNAALVGALLEESGAKIVIDSSKVGLRLKYLLCNPDLNVRVLRLIRDGRGVALTHTNPAQFADAAEPGLRSGGSGLVRPDFRLPIHEAALLWRRSNEEADCVTASLGKSVCMEVRYEQLCQHPDETLQSICRFLEISPMPIGNNFRQRKLQHIVGNGMRFDTSSEIRLDERWKTQLSENDLKVFNRLSGGLNRKYGYV
jgi:hypothetical protein